MSGVVPGPVRVLTAPVEGAFLLCALSNNVKEVRCLWEGSVSPRSVAGTARCSLRTKRSKSWMKLKKKCPLPNPRECPGSTRLFLDDQVSWALLLPRLRRASLPSLATPGQSASLRASPAPGSQTFQPLIHRAHLAEGLFLLCSVASPSVVPRGRPAL